ncbi:putative membrane protein [Streptacidiphilus sp. MAP12-20]|uniref:histidine kinase n=1 Tax=Streptacidiphilus sp. MAP12-20 TaxID=3156299 RepID=UPI003511707C
MKDMSEDMEHDDKVLFFTITDPDRATAAFGEVTALPTVSRAALLRRDADGTVTIPQDFDPAAGGSMLGFGTVGALLGLLGGPLGVAIGATLGLGLGAVSDGAQAENETDALVGLVPWVDPNSCLLVAEMVESDPRAVDAIAARYDAKLDRVPAAEAAARLAKAQAAAAGGVDGEGEGEANGRQG